MSHISGIKSRFPYLQETALLNPGPARQTRKERVMLKGSMPALITPFKDGAVDLDTLKKLVDWHIDQGSHGLVPVGTTGESPTLTMMNMNWLLKLWLQQRRDAFLLLRVQDPTTRQRHCDSLSMRKKSVRMPPLW